MKASLVENEVIEGRYRIISLLAEASSEALYLAEDLVEEKAVAVKLLKPEVASSYVEDFIRFKRDIKAVSTFNHPNILAVKNAGEHSNAPYVVMALPEGRYLSELLKGADSGGTDNGVEIARQVAEGLRYAHTQGIVHRNLKPASIVLAPEDNAFQAKLLDFGFSHIVELNKIKDEEEILQTFGYMSPEATGILKRPVDGRSDIYSLGIILYHLIIGRLPYNGGDMSTLMYQHIAQEPLLPTWVNSSIPPVIERIILRLIAKDPLDRYQTVSGLLADLEEYLRQKREGEETPDFEIARSDRLKELSFVTRLIGRDRELGILRDSVTRSRDSKGSVSLVYGNPGIGKTRLVDEVRGHVHSVGGIFVRGSGSQSDIKTPFGVFKGALSGYVRKLKRADKEERKAAVKRMKKAVGELGGEVVKIVPEVVELIGNQPELIELESEKARVRFLVVVTNFILSLGKQGSPLALFLDDLQWADQGSIELLERIGQRISTHPVAVLASFRDAEVDRNHPLTKAIANLRKDNLPLHDVPVRPFAIHDTARLLSELLLEDEDAVLALAEDMQQRTGGNPFFVLELLRSLVDEKIVYFADNRYRYDLERLAKASLPTDIVEAILKRLTDVSVQTQKILSYASVIKRDIHVELLSELVDMPQEEILDALEEGIRNQFLVRDRTGQEHIYFAHERIREAFYRKVPEKERRALHKGVGIFLEQHRQGSFDVILYDLAHHFARAGIEEKALAYSLRAAGRAQRTYAHDQAIRLYEAARGILQRQQKTSTDAYIDLLENLGIVYKAAGRFDEALAVLQDCERLISEKDKVRKAQILSKAGDVLWEKGEGDLATKLLGGALESLGVRLPEKRVFVGIGILKELVVQGLHILFPDTFVRKVYKDDPKAAIVVRLLMRTSYFHYFTDLNRCLHTACKMLNMAERMGPSRVLSNIYSAHAVIWSGIPLAGRAKRDGERAVKIAQNLRDRAAEGSAYGYCAVAAYANSDPEESYEYALRNIELLKGIGEYWDLGLGMYYRVTCGIRLGKNLNTVLEHVEEMIRTARGADSRQTLGWGLSLKARVLAMIGDVRLETEGIKAGEDSVTILEEARDNPNGLQARSNLAFACLRAQQYEKAIRWTEDLAELFPKHNNRASFIFEILPLSAHVYLESVRRKPGLTDEKKGEYLKKAFVFCRQSSRFSAKFPYLRSYASQVNGTYQWLSGKKKKAIETLEVGIKHAREYTRDTYRLASLLMEEGSFLQEDDPNNKKAREYLAEAQELFTRIGAQLDGERITNLLTPIGGTMHAVTPRERLQSERRMATVLHTGRHLSAILDLDELLERIMDSAIELVGAERGILILCNRENEGGKEELVVKVVRNVRAEDMDSLTYSRSVVAKALNSRQSLLIHDASTDIDPGSLPNIASLGARSVLCVPMITKGKLLGAVYLDNQLVRGLFNEKDLEILELISSQAAVSVENARLYNDSIQNQKALKESEEKYRLISENASDLIAVTTLEGMHTYVSPSHRQYGYEPERLIGKSCLDLVHPDDREHIRELMEKYRKIKVANSPAGTFAPVAERVEFRFPTQFGEWRYFGSTLNPVFDRLGKPTSFLLVSRDITRRKQAEEETRLNQEQLFQAAKMASLGTLVSGVAHEINNPMSYVMLNAPILEKFWRGIRPILDEHYRHNGDFNVANMDYAQLCEEIPALLTDIVDGTKRVKSIVADLKEFAQQTPQELTDDVDINYAVRRALSLVANLIKNSTVHFSVIEGSGIPVFKGNIQRVEQVIVNLIVNACQALSDKQQAVTVVTRYVDESDSVIIEVRDEGSGIPADLLERIKDPFFTTKREVGGTGLGLAITDRIVQSHGGTIEFTSTPGKDTTVTVSFPVQRA